MYCSFNNGLLLINTKLSDTILYYTYICIHMYVHSNEVLQNSLLINNKLNYANLST